MQETSTKQRPERGEPATTNAKPVRRRSHRATAKSDATRRNIIAAAMRCFYRDGYFRTNVSSVAKEAGVTRGCLQYYFETTEDLLRNAATQVVDDLWASFAQAIDERPDDIDSLDYQIDATFMAARSERFQILVELMAASRTEPLLRPILHDAMARFDKQRIQLTGEVFDDVDKGYVRNFRIASDLAVMVSTGLAIYMLPEPADQRREDVKDAAKDEIYRLWGVERTSKPA